MSEDRLRLKWTGMPGVQMEARLGDYVLRAHPERWFIFFVGHLGARALGFEDDETGAQLAAEAALFEIIELYRPWLCGPAPDGEPCFSSVGQIYKHYGVERQEVSRLLSDPFAPLTREEHARVVRTAGGGVKTS